MHLLKGQFNYCLNRELNYYINHDWCGIRHRHAPACFTSVLRECQGGLQCFVKCSQLVWRQHAYEMRQHGLR